MNMLLMLIVNYFLLLNHIWSQRKSEEPYLIMVNGKQALSHEGCYKHYQKKKNPPYDLFSPSLSHSIWNIKNISYIKMK